MKADKVKQYVALIGGWLSAVLLFLQSLGIEFAWFTEDTIGTFTGVLMATVPFVLIVYGVYKNSYVITDKAKEQEETLKKNNLK